MRKILFLFLATCLSLISCNKDDDDDEIVTPYNLQITFVKGSDYVESEVSIYSIDNENIPIAFSKINQPSGTGIAMLNVGNYFIRTTLNRYSCGFQIRDKQITCITIQKDGTPVIEFEDNK